MHVMTLPTMAAASKLEPVPDVTGEFAVVNSTDLPKMNVPDATAYVVSLSSSQDVTVLAAIRNDQHVLSVTPQQFGSSPTLRDDLWLTTWNNSNDDGAILVETETGDGPRTMGEYEHVDGKYHVVGLVGDAAYAGEHSLPEQQFLAYLWLTLCYGPRQRGAQVGEYGGRIIELLSAFGKQELPDAFDTIMWKGTTSEGKRTDFERFAARQLVEAGAARIRDIAAEQPLGLIRLTSTQMFWMQFDNSSVEGLQRDVLLSVEAALNRLAFIQRRAERLDNEMGMLITMDEAACYERASQFLHIFSDHAQYIEDESHEENALLEIGGVSGTRGGNWDAYTRFGNFAEHLVLPFRLEYRFDVNSATGTAAVRCNVPTAMMFASTDYVTDPDGSGHTVDVRDQRRAYASSYAFRLAGLLAMAAFRSSLKITSVQVNCHSGSINDDCVLSLSFDRSSFLMNTVPAYLHGNFDDANLDTDPLAIYNMLGANAYSAKFNSDRGLLPVAPLPIAPSLTGQRTPLWRDNRPLPEKLRKLLRADYACELDVMHDDGVVQGSEVSAIIEENEDSPLIASMELEAALLRLEEALLNPANAANGMLTYAREDDLVPPKSVFDECKDAQGRTVHPLYCERPIMRMTVGLDGTDDSIRYRKIPDAFFDANLLLGRMNCEAGNRSAAVQRQVSCAKIAPTTSQPFIDLAMTYADQDDDSGNASDFDAANSLVPPVPNAPYIQAASALTKALEVAIMPVDVAFIYYRLAYAFWQQDRLEEAIACYAKSLAFSGTPFHSHAVSESEELLPLTGRNEMPSEDEANKILKSRGVPVAPSKRAHRLVTQAAIGLVDAGFPRAADEAVWLVGRTVEGDVISAMSQGLRWGVGDMVSPTE